MLQGAFYVAAGVAGGAVGAFLGWGRSYQADYVEQTLGFEWFGHADDGAELVAGGIVGGLGGFRQENYRDALQAVVAFDDEAEVVAGHVRAFDFSEENGWDGGTQDIECLLSSRDDDDRVAVAGKNVAHDVRGLGIRFNDEHYGLLLGAAGMERRVRHRWIYFRGVGGGFGFCVDELDGDGEMAILFDHADDFRGLRGIESGCRARIWKCNFEALTFPISGTRGGEEESIARHVNAFANFFEGFRRIDTADVDLSSNFGAFAAAAFNGDLGRG